MFPFSFQQQNLQGHSLTSRESWQVVLVLEHAGQCYGDSHLPQLFFLFPKANFLFKVAGVVLVMYKAY